MATRTAVGHVYKRGTNVAVTFRYIPQQSRLNYTKLSYYHRKSPEKHAARSFGELPAHELTEIGSEQF